MESPNFTITTPDQLSSHENGFRTQSAIDEAPGAADNFDDDHLAMALAERRTRRLERRLPGRFRDDPPEPLVEVPPLSVDLSHLPVEVHSPICEGTADDSPVTLTIPTATTNGNASFITQCFRTPRNAFHLLREYLSPSPPSHDPEELVDFPDLCDDHREIVCDDEQLNDPGIVMTQRSSLPKGSLGPYPNLSSFMLGEWYWVGSRQKSLEDFRSLLDVIKNPDFRPQDVHNTNWQAVDKILGENNFDHVRSTSNSNDWLDESDADWRKRPITISVPFHRRAKHPGAKDFYVGDLYHRSIISVIKEKLSNPDETRHFHYEPFKLLWQRYPGQEERVHGELYTSPAFLEAHRDLLASPNEPGCDLQKVVVALMFLSDATHLTQFGTAKVWPAYLMFGNDSKYRRCKPSCNLCHHIAYFQGVSRCYTIIYIEPI